MEKARSDDRRGFLRSGLAALGACFAALFGVPGAATVVDPALRSAGGGWVDAGPVDAVKAGEAVRFTYDVASGWETVKEAAYLVRAGDDVIALSSKCTHFGCRVRWRGGAGAAGFQCPCHDGRFTPAGAPDGGPPTKPLPRFEVRIEDGRVKVKV